jgi:hypothetical protein
MAYTTQYGLPQNVVNYLNQQLPTADIYGGVTSVPFTFDDVAAEQQIESQAATGLTPEQLLLLQRQNTGGDGPMGGGKFGNLDLSDTKDFYVGDDVVTGYRNLNTGAYQDIDGLNIQNLGIRGLPGITGILDSFRTSAPKYPGYFDYYNATDLITNPKSFFNFYKQPTPQEIVQQRGLAKQNMAEAREITEKLSKQEVSPQDLARGDRGRDRGPGETSSGSFGRSTNDSGFSDYS